MKWLEITDAAPRDTDLLFRIETDENKVVYSGGELFTDGELLYVLSYAGYDNCFDLSFLCDKNQLQRYGIKSIHYIDPREIK